MKGSQLFYRTPGPLFIPSAIQLLPQLFIKPTTIRRGLVVPVKRNTSISHVFITLHKNIKNFYCILKKKNNRKSWKIIKGVLKFYLKISYACREIYFKQTWDYKTDVQFSFAVYYVMLQWYFTVNLHNFKGCNFNFSNSVDVFLRQPTVSLLGIVPSSYLCKLQLNVRNSSFIHK